MILQSEIDEYIHGNESEICMKVKLYPTPKIGYYLDGSVGTSRNVHVVDKVVYMHALLYAQNRSKHCNVPVLTRKLCLVWEDQWLSWQEGA